MTSYAVLIPADERAWEAASAEQKAAMYAKHAEFAKLLAERGHTVTGGSELTPSWTAKTVTAGPGNEPIVTDGPYAEAAEQLSGFYLVDSDDLDDLLACVAVLAGPEGRLEVRQLVAGES